MKIFKTILRIVLFILLLIVITVVVFMIIIYDGSTTEFNYDENVTIERVLGEGLDTSLARIASLDSEERETDKNKIVLSLTVDELNNFVVDAIRSQINSDYLIDDNKTIIESGPAKLNSLFFEDFESSKLGIKARVEGLGFYKTSLTLAGSPEINGNNLEFKFENFKFGNNIGISKDQVLSVKNFFGLDFGSIQSLDLNEMVYSLDISNFMASSNIFSSIVMNVEKECKYSDNEIILSFDTRDIFTELNPIQEPVLSIVKPELSSLVLNKTLVLTEEQFNYLISFELNKTETEAKENGATAGKFSIGDKEFTYNIENLYYNIDTEQMQAHISINEAKANLVADVDIIKTFNPSTNNLESLKLKVKTIKLGNVVVDASKFFDEIEIPANNFTFGYDISLEDVTFNKEEEKCNIKFKV